MGYYINQAKIAEVFCINKDRPELKCEGKCHMIAQVEQSDDEGSSHNTVTEVSFNLEYFEITKVEVPNPFVSLPSYEMTAVEHTLSGYNRSVWNPPQFVS